MLKKVGDLYMIKVDGKRLYLLEDELLALFNELAAPCADICQARAGITGEYDDRDDAILEEDWVKMQTPRKKRAERLNDGDDSCPSTT